MTNYEGTTDLAAALPEPVPNRARPPKIWGFWATAFWGFGAILIFGVGQLAAAILYALWPFDGPVSLRAVEGALTNIDQNGPAVAVVVVASVPCLLAFLAFAIARSRTRIADYLALKWPRRRDILIGVALLFALLAFDAMLAAFAGVETPSFMTGTFESGRASGFLPLLIFAFIVAAPVGEEVLFRGFLYRGFAAKLGVPVAILVTSALWAILHIQYEWFFVVQIVTLGVFFGGMRWKSGSTLLTILLHGLNNSLALLALAFSQ